jgi:hypothetical protein
MAAPAATARQVERPGPEARQARAGRTAAVASRTTAATAPPEVQVATAEPAVRAAAAVAGRRSASAAEASPFLALDVGNAYQLGNAGAPGGGPVNSGLPGIQAQKQGC